MGLVLDSARLQLRKEKPNSQTWVNPPPGSTVPYFLTSRCGIARKPLKQAVILASALSLLYPAAWIPGYSREEFLKDLLDEAEGEIRNCSSRWGFSPGGVSETSLFEAMYSARAMRWLKPDPVPPQLIRQILEAAIQAPNAGNRQSWLFMVVRDAEQRRRIGAIYQRVSHWVLKRYQHQGKPDYQSEAEYDRMMSGGLHLYDHMGDAPVLLIPCLRIAPVELPEEIPAEVRAAMREAYPWTAGASIYPASAPIS